MHPNKEDQSQHLVPKSYQKEKELLKEMLGIRYVIKQVVGISLLKVHYNLKNILNVYTSFARLVPGEGLFC